MYLSCLASVFPYAIMCLLMRSSTYGHPVYATSLGGSGGGGGGGSACRCSGTCIRTHDLYMQVYVDQEESTLGPSCQNTPWFVMRI